MEMNFSIGKDISLDFSIGGGAPAPPTPVPVAAYSEFIAVSDPCIMGIVTSSWEEISDGN